jgi:hypothetical protein
MFQDIVVYLLDHIARLGVNRAMKNAKIRMSLFQNPWIMKYPENFRNIK